MAGQACGHRQLWCAVSRWAKRMLSPETLLAYSAARPCGVASLARWAARIALRLRVRGAAQSQRVRWAARASRDGHTFGRFGRFCALRMLRRPLGLWARAAWLRAGAKTPCAYPLFMASDLVSTPSGKWGAAEALD